MQALLTGIHEEDGIQLVVGIADALVVLEDPSVVSEAEPAAGQPGKQA